jgi:hypothetical protein
MVPKLSSQCPERQENVPLVRVMIIMLSNQTGIVEGYLAAKYPGKVGHLFSPGGQRGPWDFMPYALDNGAFPAFTKKEEWDAGAWFNLLRWAQWSGQQPLWALVPDVVGDRVATLKKWEVFSPMVVERGFKPAFAVQDGMTFDDAPDGCVLFLGGSTEWKCAAIPRWCEKFTGRVHVGRVNTIDRLLAAYRAGAISVDGTGWFHKGQRAGLIKFLEETCSQ